MKRITALTWFTTIIAIYHLAVLSEAPAFLGYFLPNQMHLAVSVTCALVLIFILRRARAKPDSPNDDDVAGGGNRIHWIDWLLIASIVFGNGYVILFFDKIQDYGMYGTLDTWGMIVALSIAIPLLEAVRRTTGWALPIIILLFVFGTIFQRFLPGLLYGTGYPLERLLYSSLVGESGIFGLPLNVAANIVIIFLIFGATMQGAGAGKWFIDVALSLTGWSRGGPAKAAVLSSALFGSISGSPSSNVATTGVFTIPMMIKIGYRPAFAGAVESVASTGGQILPPVMGAIAFVMAEWINVPYSQIAIAALVPALLYYLIVFVSVHLQAKKSGISAMPRSALPKLVPVLREGWHYLIPIGVLIWLLIVEDLPPGMAAMYSIVATIATSFLSKDRANWLTPRRIMFAFEDGVRRWVVVAAITGSVGIMIGALELSGVGIKLSAFIVDLAGGNLYLALFLIGFASLIVGMGLDSIPSYITLATLMAPALVNLGVPLMAAHLYVVYWGLASFYTPPMCIAVYVAIGIAGSKVWQTGWEAVRIGIAAFLIPFAFAINQGLMLEGTLGHIVLATSTAVVGAVLVACAVQGYLLGDINVLERLVVFVAGVLFILPGYKLPLVGFALMLGLLATQRYGGRLARRTAPAAPRIGESP